MKCGRDVSTTRVVGGGWPRKPKLQRPPGVGDVCGVNLRTCWQRGRVVDATDIGFEGDALWLVMSTWGDAPFGDPDARAIKREYKADGKLKDELLYFGASEVRDGRLVRWVRAGFILQRLSRRCPPLAPPSEARTRLGYDLCVGALLCVPNLHHVYS